MIYKDYIDLGFKRTDLDCSVEFKQTGYGGFVLSKKLNKLASIEVCNGEFDKPKLFINKDNASSYILIIKPEEVVRLLKK
jgi:hypothetical protein